ncbi:MAG: L,D-transpeptidase family protein, partial [Alphaproteobacteria bacterium]|nr:L,D-transpeptidase family protein [Alphaproteobacteria bacterium]
ILVNIAGYELEVVAAGNVVMNMKVVVGQTKRQTPVFSSTMTHIILNPVWHVPRHLAIADVLPKLKHDPAYITKMGMRLYSVDAAHLTEVNPANISWGDLGQSHFPYRLHQNPGSKNALGRIKFLLPNPYDIYLHDTPHRELFSKSNRSASSGCIRLEKPRELATYLLQDRPEWSREKIDAVINRGRTETVPLKTPLPVHLMYRTAWSDSNGRVYFRQDIYERDKVLAKVLFGDS